MADDPLDRVARAEVDAAHAHWVSTLPLHRNTSDPGYLERWYAEQCGGCRYWFPLDGSLGDDWGACSGPYSPLDGRVTFEHDGCVAFERGAGKPFA